MSDGTRCPECGGPVEPGATVCARCEADATLSHGLQDTLAATAAGEARAAPAQSTMRQTLREATAGEYEILSELGRGGMATVFLAHDLALDRRVAIKVMAPHLLAGEGMAERFKLEARTAAQLSHPHIIPIYAVKETESTLYFVMKFVEGRALDDVLLKSTGPLPVPMVVDVLTKVGSALGYAHRRGVVHRDVKPGNIMIDEEGTPIVADFGIAKVAEKTGLTVTGTTIGTPSYMSPEQCEAKPVTGASDQYSLGVVAFEMLTGSLPFSGDSAVTTMYKHVHEPLPRLLDFRPDCPPEVVEAVTRMTAKDPAERWPSLEAAIQRLGVPGTGAALDPVEDPLAASAMRSDEEPTVVYAATAPSGTRDAAGGRRRVVGAVVGVLAVAAGTVAVLQPWGEPGSDTGADSPTEVPAPAGTQAPQQESGQPAGADVASTPPVSPAAEAPARDSGGDTPGDAASGPGTDDPTPRPSAPARAAPALVEVRIDGVPTRLEVGESVALGARTLDATGAPMSGADISWGTTDESVARVSPSGLLTAVGPGQAVVRASVGDVTGTESLTVEEATAASVTVGPSSLSLTVGDQTTLAAQPRRQDGTPLQDGSVTWSSDDPSVASVSSSGDVTAVGPGRTRITASSGVASAAAEVLVALETRAAIEALIAEYARALESRDIAAVRRAYPGLTNGQATQLSDAFESMENLRAQLSVDSVDEQADAATARVSGSYRFVSDGRPQETPVSFEAVFERVGAAWRLTHTR